MNTKNIKDNISSMVGKSVSVKVYIGRNKYEYYDGVIENVYPYLFTLRTLNMVKSFSYADILTKSVQIKLINA